jgi:hypothetical protein
MERTEPRGRCREAPFGLLTGQAIYRLGVDGVGVLLGLELPPGIPPGALPVSGMVEVGGDADGGTRSRFGLSLTPP